MGVRRPVVELRSAALRRAAWWEEKDDRTHHQTMTGAAPDGVIGPKTWATLYRRVCDGAGHS